MSRSSGLCVGVVLAILVVSSPTDLWSVQAEVELQSVIAVYKGGSVSSEELESWARARGKEIGEIDIRTQIEQIALVEVLAERALAAGLDKEEGTAFRLRETENAVLEAALRNHMAAQVVVPEERIKSRYRELHHRYHRPRTVRLINIFKRFRPDDDPEERARLAAEMEGIRKVVLEGADFAEMAREHSDSQTRFRGGVIGFVGPGRLPPAVDVVAMKMTPGEISEVIETPDGLTLLRCDAADPPVETSYDQARPMLQRSLRAKEYELRWEAFERQVLEGLALVINQPELHSEKTAGDATVVRSSLGHLSRSDADRVVAAAAEKLGTEELDKTRATAALRNHFVRIAAVGRARELGLDEENPTKDRLAWRRLRVLQTEQLRSMIEKRLQAVTEAEVQAYWRDHRERFVSRPRYSLSVIRMTIDQDRVREQWVEGLDLVDRLYSGDAVFEEAAREISDHPSAPSGGRAGWIPRPRLAATPNVLLAVEKLSPGETSGLVEQDGRLWIVRLDDREEEREMTFLEARDRAENTLGNARIRRLQSEIENGLVAELELDIFEPGA